MKQLGTEALRERVSQIRLLGFDIDGVMTDGTLFLGAKGEELKAFNSQDGLGLKMLVDAGMSMIIISGRGLPGMAQRFHRLGIDMVYERVENKLKVMEDACLKANIGLDQVAFVGDDLPDMSIMSRAGLAIAVANAHPYVIEHAHHVTSRAGGHGAVREVCDLFLDARGLLQQAIVEFLD